MERLEKIKEACHWVASKGAGSRDGCKVTTRVKWADWDAKEFSPAMCVLWWSEVKKRPDGYNTFWIPRPETWIDIVAEELGVGASWVETFVKQCTSGVEAPTSWTLTVTFDGTGIGYLKNPRIDWKRNDGKNGDLFPESEWVISTYGTQPPAVKIPYWTKNPPVNLYKSKLGEAVYDLFCALEAAGDEKIVMSQE